MTRAGPSNAPIVPRGAIVCGVTGKWGLTKGQAKSEAKRQERRTGFKFNVWKCVCGGWHIGKRPRR